MNQQQNSIELVSVTFNAGESRLFALSGEYFEVIDAPSPIDVILSDFNGAQRARMNQAAASFYSKGVAYGVIQITSASAQTIRFAYGTGETGTRRSTGSVTVSGAIALDAATLLALEQTNVRPEAITGSYASTGALAANVADTVFAPGANTNGAIVLTAYAQDVGNVAQMSCFIAKAGPVPTSAIDGEVIAQSQISYSANMNPTVYSINLQNAQFVPAGKGLYFITASGLFNPPLGRSCRFRLL